MDEKKLSLQRSNHVSSDEELKQGERSGPFCDASNQSGSPCESDVPRAPESTLRRSFRRSFSSLTEHL